jgi:hypothetical protein
MTWQPLLGQGLLIAEVPPSYPDTPHSSGRVIGASQISLPDNTQHSQETNSHAPTGIRTHDPNKRTAADPHLKPRGHRDRLEDNCTNTELSF